MRLHEINISPRSITIDGIPLLHSDEAPTVETLAPDLHLVHLTVYASRIQLDADAEIQEVMRLAYEALHAVSPIIFPQESN